MYVENKFHHEDWEVDNGDGDVSIISIVNDFFKIESWHTELEPLEYWVEMPGVGSICGWDSGGTYKDCVEWIKGNYLNSQKVIND